MALKNFDFKQFLLEKGERIGLYVAVGLMALLLVLGLRSLFGNSASANQKTLNDLITQKKGMIQGSKPSEAEAKEIAEIDPNLTRAMRFTKVEAEKYPNSVAFFVGEEVEDNKRRGPQVKVPSEWESAVARAQVRTYRLSPDRERILVLVDSGGGGKKISKVNQRVSGFFTKTRGMGVMGNMMGPQGGGSGGPGGASGPVGINPSSMRGPMGGGSGGPMGEGAMGSFRAPGMMDQGDTDSKSKTKMIKIEDLEKDPNARPAEDITPVRMAIIVGSFPYKEQLESFRQALRFNNLGELFSDPASAPQFKGFEVQRAEVKPGDTEEALERAWKPLTYEKDFTPLALLTGKRWESDEAQLDPVIFPGLAMPRPQQFREDQYPKVEDKLKKIQDTLAELKKAQQGTIPKPKNPFKDAEDLDIFSKEGSSTGGLEGGMGGAAAMPPGAAGSRMPRFTTPMGDREGAATDSSGQFLVPEYILLRFIDVSIEPGKMYRYKMRIRMVNPNYQSKNVAWASLAQEKELKSDWVVVDKTVQVPPELYYYAIDLKTQGSKEEQRALWQDPNPHPDQLPVQAHRWVGNLYPDEGSSAGFSVGDWCIAERTLVTRGEKLGHKKNVEVPIWDVGAERFGLASYGKARRDNKKLVPVFFGPDGPDSLVVDFRAGPVDYNKFVGMEEDKPQYKLIHDKAPAELLIMSADGKLSVHHGDADMNDDERKAREEAWKKRIEEIKANDKPKGGPMPGGTQANPFNRDS
jgi:hypothetical protein